MSLSDLPTPELAKRLKALKQGDGTDPMKANQLTRACAGRLMELHAMVPLLAAATMPETTPEPIAPREVKGR